MMRQLLILADDLSGAADCANACMRSGLSAVVTFDDAGRHVTSEVLSIDCDTRHLESDDAAARVVNVMRRHIGVEPDLLLFKKVDSTLRGNVAVELSAVLKERRRLTNGKERIVSVMAPAFPSGGRTTIEGNQMVHGVALHKTEMWIHDGLVGPAHIPSMLAKAGLRPASLGLNLVRGDGKQLKLAMQQMAGEADVLVCDVEKDEDLSAIAEASMVLGRQTVWAGSAGLAHQVPHAAGLSGRSRSFQQPRFADGPLLFVIGSMSSVSRRQAEVLEREVPIAGIHVSPSLLLAGPHAP
ncbi:MAG TPA: four-carbon acid sugar kinase family protein, partial [Edaphobacter sp.]|nr:four-carbon acid sugar kinase family protein [Edaphobacter sp.]